MIVPAKQPSVPSLQREQEHEKQLEDLRREVSACKGLLKQHEEDRKKMDDQQAEIDQLRNKLQQDPGMHTYEYVEQKFEVKLESLKTTLQETIKTECKAILEKSYADAAKSGTNPPDSTTLKECIKDAWREEEAEEYNKHQRAPNVIVHGVVEQTRDEDKVWASNLIKDTHTRANIKRVTRLGKVTDGKKRPILITLEDEFEKWNLLGNLPVLKGNNSYKKISVTEDLTFEERKVFKELSTEAKKRNDEEKSAAEVWRLRGDSKNGFCLKKMKFVK